MSVSSSGVFRTFSPIVAALLLSVSGCGAEKEKRHYPIPESLCDLNFGSDLLAPFLPPGDRIHQTEENDDTDWSCEVSVDGEDVFQITWEWWESGWSARRFAPSQAYVDPENESTDGSYVYSNEGAVTAVHCTERGEKWDIFLVAKVWNGGIPNANAMKNFITAYREEFSKDDPCADL